MLFDKFRYKVFKDIHRYLIKTNYISMFIISNLICIKLLYPFSLKYQFNIDKYQHLLYYLKFIFDKLTIA